MTVVVFVLVWCEAVHAGVGQSTLVWRLVGVVAGRATRTRTSARWRDRGSGPATESNAASHPASERISEDWSGCRWAAGEFTSIWVSPG